MAQGFRGPFPFPPGISPRFKHSPVLEKLALLQYVDDLLLCSVTKEVSIQGSIYLLQQLAEEGSKVSKEKLQWSLDTVHNLGHDLSPEGIQLFPKRIQLSQEFPRPTTSPEALENIAFHNLQWSRHPLHWAHHTNFDENLANLMELSLSLSPSIIRVRSRELMGSPNLKLADPVREHKVTLLKTVMSRPVSIGIQPSANPLLSQAIIASPATVGL